MTKRLQVETNKALSSILNELVSESHIGHGFIVIQGTSITGAVVLSACEKYAEAALFDLERELTYLIPSKEEFVSKDDPKLVSSICKSSLVGSNVVLPINQGKIVLGEKEDIYCLEFYNKDKQELIVSIN